MSNVRMMKEIKVIKESKEMYIDMSDDNMKNFKIMFFGPPDSVFHNGVFVFEFNIPDGYPFEVPRVKFLTGGIVGARMHPNLYKEGKVCLSILNTWGSNEWSPLLTIEKIILTIKGLLDNNPISHEPPYKSCDPHYNAYSLYYSMKSIPSVYSFYKNYNHPFASIILSHVKEQYEEILKKMEELKVHNKKSYRTIHHNEMIYSDYVNSSIMELLKE